MPSVKEGEEEEEGSEAAVRDAACLGGVGWERVGDTGKGILEESGLPVGRERRATSSAMAGGVALDSLAFTLRDYPCLDLGFLNILHFVWLPDSQDFTQPVQGKFSTLIF
jgi:hypothetical protein